MSRCFSFPPPGYTRNESRSDALIQSIKLQMETENPKKDRKERKKEKKEKKERKKEKKEKKEGKEKRRAEKEKKRKESTTSLSDVACKKLKSSHSNDAVKKLASHSNDAVKEFKFIDAAKETKADGKLQKDVDSDLAERSVVTEELGQPAVCPQEPCTSDSSQNSKRKRGSLLPSQNHSEKGTSIKIRIPLKRLRELEESKQVFQLGSSSGNVKAADPLIQDTRSDSQLECTTNVEASLLTGKFDSRKCNPLQNTVLEVAPVAPVPIAVDDENQRMVALYNSLFQFQIPPLTDVGTDFGLDSLDQDWLFSSTKPAKAKHVSMKPKNDSVAFQCSKYMGPRAQYLPEVEIYALPYAVPF